MKTPTTCTYLSLTSDKTGPADSLAIDGVDHLEIWCGNAKQSAFYYRHAFGLPLTAYRGPETGHREAASYVLSRGDLSIVLTTPLVIGHPAAHQIALHGDFVKHVAYRVPSASEFLAEALKRGGELSEPLVEISDGRGIVRRGGIKTYGDVTHPIIERGTYSGPFLPGFVDYASLFGPQDAPAALGLRQFDHIVGNVELGKMEYWVEFYERVLGFTQMKHFSDKEISTEYSALMSKVMRNGSGKIKMPINEPATGKRKSQIEEYLEFNHGPGVQHIAILTDNIIDTVSTLRQRGVHFLRVPKAYYEDAPQRVGKIREDFARIAELGILVDRDEEGYLLQIFTKPVQDRPTLFFEIIQREGSQGFGAGNFKALFEAIEREQAARGNL